VHLIRCATLTVSSLESAEAYVQHLDYDRIESGVISQKLAASWQAEKLAGANYVVLRPSSGANIYIRMIEQPAPKTYKPLISYGWAAIEICTQDTHAVNQRMQKASGFEIIGKPKELDGVPAIFPMQIKGPNQEVVYLTQIRDDLPDYDLPRAESFIDKIFILVLACSDINAEGQWFEKHLGLSKGRTMELNYKMINTAFGLPDGTKHKLATLRHGRDVFLEIDQYPESAKIRETQPGYLPPCVAIGSFHHPEFTNLEDINDGFWLSEPEYHVGVIYAGKKSACLRTPSGTLIEMIES